MTSRVFSYENGLVLMMCLTNGVVALDRLAVSFLAPYIVDEFHLTNTQVGLLSSVLSVAIAVSGYALAALADATHRRKLILLVMLSLFSAASALTGLARSFGVLLGVRAFLGLTEGPLAPIGQSVTAIESSEHRRGLNMGIALNLGAALIGMGAGPIIATHLADAWGWRAAMFLSCVPGLALVAAIALFMRPVREAPAEASANWKSALELLKSRNILICLAISGIYSAWLIVQGAFLPLYLVRVDHIKPTDMGLVVSAGGLATAIAGMGVPALSDRIGRRPALILATFLGIAAPLATLFAPPSPLLLSIALFFGYFGGGAGPLYVGVIPSESAPARHVATAVALSLASGELIGGVLGPTLAGRAADAYGLAAPFWISAGCAAVCGVLSLFLKETAPSRRSVDVALGA